MKIGIIEEKDQWIPYQNVNWDCPKNNRFWIDTRDFHAGYNWSDEPHKDFDTLKKYDHFFHTKEEMLKILDRLFEESGGKAKWRFLSTEKSEGWELKYIRIQRTEKGFLICNEEWKALRPEVLNAPVDQDLLN